MPIMINLSSPPFTVHQLLLLRGWRAVVVSLASRACEGLRVVPMTCEPFTPPPRHPG